MTEPTATRAHRGPTVEALDRYCPQSLRRWAKRDLARARRRAERRDLESAGTRRRHFLRGWIS
jgi:hypothetical protein